jgi:hypothetical protein
VTQSLDRRWVLVQQPGQVYQFDLFDLNEPTRAPEVVLLPQTILTNPGAPAALRAVEWSSNNRHILVERQYESKTEFILFDRENPAESININALMGVAPIKMTLRDRRSDQVYLLDSIPGTLRSADLRNRTISAPLVQQALDYKGYQDQVLLYATQEGVETGKTEFRIWDKGVVYPLKLVNQADAYVLDVNRYENRWYYIVGSALDNMAFVYENPVTALKSAGKTPLVVAGILRLDNPRFASFSKNNQYIALQSGSNLLTMDLEDRQQYRIALAHDISLSQQVAWMDGHRFIYVVGGQSHIIDFDGSNQQTMVTTKLSIEPVFDRDYYNAFTFETSETEPNKVALVITPLNLSQ